MSNKRAEITGRGIAQQSGLDVFSSLTTYNGEHINFGNALSYARTLSGDTNYGTTAANPLTDALINSPASVIGEWYRYRTNGGSYVTVNAPISYGGNFIFYGKATASKPSYSGMYQKLSLTAGKEYQVSIQTTASVDSGSLYVKIYTPDGSDFTEISSSGEIPFPVDSTNTGIKTFTFTASTANDIIVIYFTTTSLSLADVSVSNISIKEKQEYLVPVYATDKYGNAHKVLRITSNQTLSNA